MADKPSFFGFVYRDKDQALNLLDLDSGRGGLLKELRASYEEGAFPKDQTLVHLVQVDELPGGVAHVEDLGGFNLKEPVEDMLNRVESCGFTYADLMFFFNAAQIATRAKKEAQAGCFGNN